MNAGKIKRAERNENPGRIRENTGRFSTRNQPNDFPQKDEKI
jgi:hypothetical protein